MGHAGMIASHIACLKITHMVETTVLHTTHTRDGKIEDITITHQHLDHHIQTMIFETFTIGGQPGQVISFIIPVHMSVPVMFFMHITLMKITNKYHKMPGLQILRVVHWLWSW